MNDINWEDWTGEMFPPNHSYVGDALTKVAAGIKDGMVIGLQFAWIDSWGQHKKAYWCRWPVKNGKRDIKQEPVTVPPALIALFPMMYVRPHPGVIPLVGLTSEEWSALWEGENGERKQP